ncbi:hypothetical protein COT42_09025 [Candidatus Saganbacteria bacterium CG08_land_8_20_14_0_20_45_16]|uniref:Uncharacterized protein n=1 Tax=Candidatus Saganbacteria bacterium CG08_land_8_20_14_0_20_45_16 TaxID=2014293 RepID=A0A2H0XT27_UNCSA|nr:MAG: hypothetical protein COT42_09025 [Candidatus Saganbacteria bacterium CG08_land_8_20_14_0_20_45_16]
MKKNQIIRFGLLLAGLLWLGIAAQALAADNLVVKEGKVYVNLKNADVKNVLQLFAKATRKNIIASSDVSGEVTVTFVGITPTAGLEALLRSQGLDWFEEAGTIYVSNKKIMRSYYLEYARPSDLAGMVKDILPSGSKVSVDDTYNALVIQTSSDYLPRLEKLIKELDEPPAQVMIEVKMIEVKHTDGDTVGLDATYTKPDNANDVAQTTGLAGRATAASAQGFYAHIVSGDINAYLSALSSTDLVNTVATPRITTISNKEASILIGQKLGYRSTVITDQQTTQQMSFLEVGTSLKITPHISKSGLIRMVVEPKISDGQIVNELPQENTTETRNEVIVRDGQTFVIGGLIKDKDTQTDYGIPFLMNIPVLGAFFRKTVTSKIKQELLVFVTPHLITSQYLESESNTMIQAAEKKARDDKARLIH